MTLYSSITDKERKNLIKEHIAKLKFKWAGDQIFIEALINKKIKGYFHLDTGVSGHTWITKQAAEEAGIDKDSCDHFEFGGKNFGVQKFNIKDVDPTDENFYGYTGLKNLIGGLGSEFMKNYKIYIDFNNKEVTFIK